MNWGTKKIWHKIWEENKQQNARSPFLPVITLNVNILNSEIKW